MSKLEELIEELCPDGVELKKIDDCTYYIQPSKYIVSDTNYVNEGTPVLTPGQSFILGYTTEEDGIYEASKENPIILFDDFTGSLQWVDFPFKVKSSACNIITAKNTVGIRYLYHLMANLNFRSDEHKRLWISIYSQFEVPIPPLPVQEEIVRILDKFTDLTSELQTELQAELQARAKQYKYYLNNFFENQKENLVPLEQVGTLTRGKRFVHADAADDGVPCVHYGELYTYYGVHADKVKSHIREDLRKKMRYAHKGDVIIVGAGENNWDIGVGVAWEGEDDVAVHDACYTLCHNQNAKYISYFLRSDNYHNQIKKWVSEGKICSISAASLGKAMIPIPSMDEQNRIVSILEQFDELCSSISKGLPAEIEARQNQYEYYRNKLLTFKELQA